MRRVTANAVQGEWWRRYRRLALAVIECVLRDVERNGQPVGACLGGRSERDQASAGADIQNTVVRVESRAGEDAIPERVEPLHPVPSLLVGQVRVAPAKQPIRPAVHAWLLGLLVHDLSLARAGRASRPTNQILPAVVSSGGTGTAPPQAV